MVYVVGLEPTGAFDNGFTVRSLTNSGHTYITLKIWQWVKESNPYLLQQHGVQNRFVALTLPTK